MRVKVAAVFGLVALIACVFAFYAFYTFQTSHAPHVPSPCLTHFQHSSPSHSSLSHTPQPQSQPHHVQVSKANLSTPDIDAKTYAKMLGVGIDVDWLSFKKVERAYFYWRARGVSIPELFREKGFRNVRIRVDFVPDSRNLTRLKEVVDDCLKAGIIPVVAYSAKELRENPNEKNAEKFVEWWRKVAVTLKDEPLVSFDLIIETGGPVKNKPEFLNAVYSRAIAAIRQISPHRIVMVTPARLSSPFELKYLNVSGKYIIAEWHIYAGGPKKRGFNRTLIESAVKTAVEWSKKTGIPTWVGAWRPLRPGVNETVCLEFTKFMSGILKKNHIPYDINADEWFFNAENLTWQREDLLRVVLDP